MSRTFLASPGAPLSRARTTNSTDTGFTAPTASATKPSGEGVVDFTSNPPSWLRFIPFGTGANNDQFDARITGFSLVNSTWVPTILLQFTATLSEFVGVASGDVTASERFADTVGNPTTNFGASGVTCIPMSPQNDTPGMYLLNAGGCTVFKAEFDLAGATTGANGLLGHTDPPMPGGSVAVTATVDSEFPAAAAGADNTATPTTTTVYSFGMVYDGTTWDFLRGTAADGALVNLGTNNDVTVTSGTITTVTTVTTVAAVTAITNALPAGTNAIGKLAANSGVDIGDVDVTSIAAGDNNIGNVDVVTLPAIPTGSNTIGAVTNVPLSNIGGGNYEPVAASQTDQMCGGAGAAGDYLAGVLIIPTTTSPGAVSIEDGSTNTVIFDGGASSVSNLVPFYVPLGIISASGGWEITTGANVRAIAVGKFT